MSDYLNSLNNGFKYFKSWIPSWKVTEPTPEITPAEKLGIILRADLKAYIFDGKKKVLEEPIKALVYSVAIKMLSLFVALVFPFIGYAAIGASLFTIDAQIGGNAKDFTNALIEKIKTQLIKMRDAFWPDALAGG